MIDFHQINELFWNFVHKYDATDLNILKKIVHTFAVARNCFDSACRLNFNEEDRLFCYLMGMFHDLGRFEQWTKYKTYVDSKSENHAVIGKQIFETEFTPQMLGLTQDRFELLGNTILYHLIEFKGDDENLWKYLRIIHSADAYDNLLNTAIGSIDLNNYADGYSCDLINKFMNGEKIFNLPSETKIDRILKSLGNAYCIVIDYMRYDVIAKNYFNIIKDRHLHYFNNEDKTIFENAINYLNNNYRP